MVLETQAPVDVQPTLPQPAQAAAVADLPDDNDLAKQEADNLLADLNNSHEEVQRMLQMQQDTATELGDLKDQLTTEEKVRRFSERQSNHVVSCLVRQLMQLQEESWRLQTYNELELLKKQLAALQNMEADLDAAEAVLDAGYGGSREGQAADASEVDQEEGAGSGEVEQSADAAEGDDEGDDEDVEYDVAEVAALQAKLDQELAAMLSQLQAVRNEAQTVSMRKAALEAELKTLLAMQVEQGDFDVEDDQLLAAGEEPEVKTPVLKTAVSLPHPKQD